jgi:hypothetical protein
VTREIRLDDRLELFSSSKRRLEGLEDLGLDADTKASFLNGNAARVFRINHSA